jgi:hypothetical protein
MEIFLIVLALIGWWIVPKILKSYRAIKEQEKRNQKIADTKFLLDYEKFLRECGKSEKYISKELKEEAGKRGIRL